MKQILFNTENVRALLEGQRTVTRRVVKPQPKGAYSVLGYDGEAHTAYILCGNGGEGGVFADWSETAKAPYWPGDILWVRETFAVVPDGSYVYKASVECPDVWKGTWKSPYCMPREAARIFLRVTGVRVEHLQEITTSQARAEGQPKCPGSIAICGKFHGCQHCEAEISNAVLWFESVWNKTIPKHPNKSKRYPYYYEDDPWVWVINFERISKEEAEG